MKIALIFIGGGLGSLARYGLGTLFPYQNGFPWATFFSNLTAAFILGAVLGWLAKQNPDDVLGNNLRFLMATGFCGGFSTFSTFSNETLSMIKQQQWTLAGVYVLSSMILGVLAVAAGVQIKI